MSHGHCHSFVQTRICPSHTWPYRILSKGPLFQSFQSENAGLTLNIFLSTFLRTIIVQLWLWIRKHITILTIKKYSWCYFVTVCNESTYKVWEHHSYVANQLEINQLEIICILICTSKSFSFINEGSMKAKICNFLYILGLSSSVRFIEISHC